LTLSFDALGVSPELVATLSRLGITEPFPIQALAIADALAGRDVCGKAKTGSGKTLAFGLPLLQRIAGASARAGALAGSPQSEPRRPGGLVLVPTRELARQVADVLAPLAQPLGCRLAVCYGGTGMDAQIKALHKGVDVVVATPGRLIDLLQRGEISLAAVETVVLDEADRMADMGFLPQVEWVLRHLTMAHQTMLFSATLDGDIDYLVRNHLTDPVRHEVVADTKTIDDMTHRFLRVHDLDRIKVLAAIAEGVSRTMVFVRTKRGADRLVSQLKREGVVAGAIHGDLRQTARERALKDFQGGHHAVLVATDVAARGIHVDDVDVVVHFDPPEEHKGYTHRSGRTARAGREGVVVTFVLWNQELDVEKLQRRIGLREPIIEVFSNDPRLADLVTLDSPAPRRKVATAS